ncbi:MAG: hypothetical protein ACUZ8A_04095 [Candidatus Bathyanammoxibius sp.]
MKTKILSLVPQEWQESFLLFVETGEAKSEFLAFLVENEDCQNAVDQVFAVQSKAFEEFARFLSAPSAS